MKLRILAALLVLSFNLSAQEWTTTKTRSSVYVTAGLNYAGSHGWEDPTEAGAGYFAGFNAGLAFTGTINKKATTQLNIEAYFSQQGFRNTLATNDADPERLVINYINVPVIIHHRPFKNFRQMYIGAGPQVGFKVGGHVKLNDGEKLELSDEVVMKTAYSGIGVVGFNFGMILNLGIEFTYQYGFTKMLETSPDIKHSVFQARMILPLDFISMLGGY